MRGVLIRLLNSPTAARRRAVAVTAILLLLQPLVQVLRVGLPDHKLQQLYKMTLLVYYKVSREYYPRSIRPFITGPIPPPQKKK